MSDISLTPAMRQNLLSLQATTRLMDMTQTRIATGRKVNTALDSPTAYFTALGLSNKAGDLATLKDAMGQGISTIESADKALTSITKLVEQMKGLTASAKAASTAAERSALASQFADLRTQVDKLASDATYGGKNLVAGRGTITGGTFTDTAAAAETALAGVATGGITRTGTDTNTGSYAFAVQQKVNPLNTLVTGSVDISLDAALTDAKSLEFFIDGVSVGTATTAAEAGTAFAAKIDALSTDLSASIVATKLQLTVAEGKVLEVRSTDGTTTLFTEIGLTAGLQNDTTGAQVKNLTSDLGIYGAEVYAHVSGYTNDAASSNVTFSVSGTTLTATDGTTGGSATIDTSVFSAAGTDTLAIGDLTVKFVTTTSTENTNASPAIAQSVAAVKQVGTVTLATTGDAFDIGDSISIVVDGTTYTQTNGTAGLLTITSMVDAWSTAHTANVLTATGIVVTKAAGVLTFTSGTAGKAFTLVGNEITDIDADTTIVAAASATPNVAQANTVTIAGNIDDGDVFSVTVNNTTVSYTAKSTDTNVTSIASGLVTAINANTTLVNGASGIIATASNAAGVITLTENAKGTAMTYSASATDASISVGNESNTSSTQALKSLTTGTATGDTRVKVTSGGFTTTADVNTTSTTAVTISNANWGSVFSFKGDDATMVAGGAATVVVSNPTGVAANDMKVYFNEDSSAFVNTNAVDVTSSGLSLSAAVNNWASDPNIDASVTEINAAITTLRSNSKALANNLGIIQTRETFTESFIDVLLTGGDKLTLANTNTEAANMLALQTRQQLGIESLSMASQSAQSILSLFR